MRIIALLAGILFSFNVFAASSNSASSIPATLINYLEGKDFTLLAEPVRPTDPSKIEVVEVFSYTCPHCMHFEPSIEAWTKKQPADVSVIQLHTSWRADMEVYQRGFYTAVALKIKDKVQMAVFNAYHIEHKELTTAQAWADFLAPYGVDKQTVIKTYDSFGVTSQINQANARTRAYKTSGTPEMVVGGKYRISTRTSGTQEDMLKVAQFLIEKIRKESKTH
jgi:protein dithiol oxidoreductase (disulfide-forming)